MADDGIWQICWGFYSPKYSSFEHYFSTCLILFRDDMKDLGAAPPNLPRNVPSRVVPSGVGARMAGKSEKRAFQW
jgi:hypothetical protein